MSADEVETIPPPPNVPSDTDLSALDPAGDAIANIASRLSILPEILRAVNASAVDARIAREQIQSVGTAIEELSHDVRALTRRVSNSESRLSALEARVDKLESMLPPRPATDA